MSTEAMGSVGVQKRKKKSLFGGPLEKPPPPPLRGTDWTTESTQCRIIFEKTGDFELVSEPIIFVSMSSIRNWYQI